MKLLTPNDYQQRVDEAKQKYDLLYEPLLAAIDEAMKNNHSLWWESFKLYFTINCNPVIETLRNLWHAKSENKGKNACYFEENETEMIIALCSFLGESGWNLQKFERKVFDIHPFTREQKDPVYEVIIEAIK